MSKNRSAKRRRVSVAVAGVAGFALAAGVAVSASAATGGTTVSASVAQAKQLRAVKPTIVLVHGAWSDSSSWSGVVKRLQAAGYQVDAPANPLRGLKSDSAYLADYLETIQGPIVLVGHSYGGEVITNAATGNPNVKALVYIAALAPDQGESAAVISAEFPGSHLSDDPKAPVPTALNAVPFTQGVGGTGIDLYLKADKYRDVFLSGRFNNATAAELAATQRPLTAQGLVEPSGTPAWKTIPSWYLVASDDHTIPPAAEKFMAARAHAHTVEVDAPHAVALTDPGAVTSLIEKAVVARG
ncbi:alpha/beta hydrolase [Kitasatospora atroaurantiaca]|uniref:Pimeloyl-ACP methyl ester carboxylesterase n=1 Tax=Kitasatospora atroaurantiaca TaxID=285545 RepID=A0A561EMB3_9ACTN|nr:alpha/beta hydrolase [Kitasatospora atroaurantiaca]TWE16712.1 pimeloyl-ACP methyl ester carboxylesterase [Kitasatospora atroaurantiaca]